MAREKVEGLIISLHDRLGAGTTSPQQERMLAQMRSHLDEWEGGPADSSLVTSAEQLLEEIGEDHPRAASVLRDIIRTLRSAGL